MLAIVTLVIKDLKKGVPKDTGIDILGRFSTDVHSRHKSILVGASTLEDVEKIALNTVPDSRISRIEVLESSRIEVAK